MGQKVTGVTTEQLAAVTRQVMAGPIYRRITAQLPEPWRSVSEDMKRRAEEGYWYYLSCGYG